VLTDIPKLHNDLKKHQKLGMEEVDQGMITGEEPRNVPITSKTAIPTNKIWYNGEWGSGHIGTLG
jgi:hypothetical protein